MYRIEKTHLVYKRELKMAALREFFKVSMQNHYIFKKIFTKIFEWISSVGLSCWVFSLRVFIVPMTWISHCAN